MSIWYNYVVFLLNLLNFYFIKFLKVLNSFARVTLFKVTSVIQFLNKNVISYNEF